MQSKLFDDISTHGTISQIIPLKRDPNLRSLRVNGRVVAWLTTEELKDIGIEVGSPWSEQLAHEVRQRHDRREAHKQAMNYLARREHSIEQLKSKLRLKTWPEDVIETVIDDLIECGWLDDRACATSIAEETVRRRPQSRAGLEAKLRSKGIDASLAAQTAASALADTDSVETAVALAERKLRSMASLEPRQKVSRIAAALARAGFEEDDVRSALERLDLLPESI